MSRIPSPSDNLASRLRCLHRLLTTAEVAHILNKHPETIYRMIRNGFPATRDGNRWKIDPCKVADWIEQRSIGVVPSTSASASGPAPKPLGGLGRNGAPAVGPDGNSASGYADDVSVQSGGERRLPPCTTAIVLAPASSRQRHLRGKQRT